MEPRRTPIKRTLAFSGLIALSLTSCSSLPKESASGIATAGQSSMGSLAAYYSETLDVVRLHARESALKEALVIEAGPCKQAAAVEACATMRDGMAQRYRDRIDQIADLERALKARHQMALSAQRLYLAYGEMASDDFGKNVQERAESLGSSVNKVVDTPIRTGLVSATLGAVADSYAARQLIASESTLEAIAQGISDQFGAEQPLWNLEYEGYLEDYTANTRRLLTDEYATRGDLGSEVISARGLKPGTTQLSANPATFYVLAEYRSEDATRSKRLAMQAGDQAKAALSALVAAHGDVSKPGALDAALTSAKRLSDIVDAISSEGDPSTQTEKK